MVDQLGSRYCLHTTNEQHGSSCLCFEYCLAYSLPLLQLGEQALLVGSMMVDLDVMMVEVQEAVGYSFDHTRFAAASPVGRLYSLE